MTTNTSGDEPAYPNPAREFVDPHDQGMREQMSARAAGMSIRDLAALKAMAALINRAHDFTSDAEASAPMRTWEDIAIGAFQMAYAFCAERAKRIEATRQKGEK